MTATAKFASYHSDNAPAGSEWLAFIYLDGECLPVRFRGETEDAAMSSAAAHWAGILEKQGADMARRAEMSRRVKERAALKAAAGEIA